MPAGSLAIVFQYSQVHRLSMCTTVLLIIWTPDFRDVFEESPLDCFVPINFCLTGFESSTLICFVTTEGALPPVDDEPSLP